MPQNSHALLAIAVLSGNHASLGGGAWFGSIGKWTDFRQGGKLGRKFGRLSGTKDFWHSHEQIFGTQCCYTGHCCQAKRGGRRVCSFPRIYQATCPQPGGTLSGKTYILPTALPCPATAYCSNLSLLTGTEWLKHVHGTAHSTLSHLISHIFFPAILLV